MNLKWKKKYLVPILGLVGAAVLIGGVYLYSSYNIQPDHQKEFKQTSKKVTKPKEKAIDLSGDYVSNERGRIHPGHRKPGKYLPPWRCRGGTGRKPRGILGNDADRNPIH